jgi:hypothetical protein
MGWDWNAAGMERRRMHIKYWCESLEEIDHCKT